MGIAGSFLLLKCGRPGAAASANLSAQNSNFQTHGWLCPHLDTTLGGNEQLRTGTSHVPLRGEGCSRTAAAVADSEGPTCTRQASAASRGECPA